MPKGCIYEDCDQEAIYCKGHTEQFMAEMGPTLTEIAREALGRCYISFADHQGRVRTLVYDGWPPHRVHENNRSASEVPVLTNDLCRMMIADIEGVKIP